MIEIDLSNCLLFDVDRIQFSHKVNFVCGRNGTGKSTLTEIISKQIATEKCHVFQGYEKILGDNAKLNAVVLGEKNVENDRKIGQKEDEIKAFELQIKDIEKKIEEPVDGSTNLWTVKKGAYDRFNKAKNEIDHFLSDAAASIKKYDPRVSIATYNKNNLLKEIKYARELSKKEIETSIELLNSKPKTAPDINFFSEPLATILNAVNDILQDKAEEHIRIQRIEDSPEKRKFAQQGLALHKSGEICAFCGNVISEKNFNELKAYFSGNELKKLDEKRKNKIKEIEKHIAEINQVKIDPDDFYPNYQEQIIELRNQYQVNSENICKFLTELETALKEKDLIEISPKVKSELPESLLKISNAYHEIRKANNENNLLERQDDARKKLRYHLIYTKLRDFEYRTKKQNEEQLNKDLAKAEQDIKSEREKIIGENGIQSKINALKTDINELKAKTQNVEILAKHINNKLNGLVSFTLQHVGEEQNGYYSVKNKDTGELRDIKDLSTGEHNIIAFLYFIEKLDEIGSNGSQEKVIIFDDPMSSNDDVMQYLMIDELNALEKRLREDDCLIILTHNKHFYLNVKYGWRYLGKGKGKVATFIRLESDNHKTHVSYIESEDNDFKTNYEALWNELIFLYKDKEALPDMLLNPIRRIVETYTKFNSITPKDFCENQEGALKLFNVNSHSIDDLEAELNGLTKDEIISILERCFLNNNASNHFESYWNWKTIKAS